jgi:hypothetical protein
LFGHKKKEYKTANPNNIMASDDSIVVIDNGTGYLTLQQINHVTGFQRSVSQAKKHQKRSTKQQ